MKKTIYILLTSFLGALLFFVIHRSLSVIYNALVIFDYQKYSLGLAPADIQLVGVITLVGFIIVGALYGVWLGNYWYRVVYIEHGGKTWLFAWKHSLFRHNPAAVAAPRPQPGVVTIKPKAAARPVMSSWEVDDLLKPAADKSLLPSRPSVVKKVVAAKPAPKPVIPKPAVAVVKPKIVAKPVTVSKPVVAVAKPAVVPKPVITPKPAVVAKPAVIAAPAPVAKPIKPRATKKTTKPRKTVKASASKSET